MKLFWIDSALGGQVAIVSRPRGGDWLTDDLVALRRDGIDILISLLTPKEIEELGLLNESNACQDAGIDFRSFAINDRSVPESLRQFQNVVELLAIEFRGGKSIGAHCRAGIGRSSMLLAGILCVSGLTPEQAFKLISSARGLQVPDTHEQVEWLHRFAEAR